MTIINLSSFSITSTTTMLLRAASLLLLTHLAHGQDRNLIVGGRPASRDYPTFAYSANGGCGATVIAPNVLLSAAHCVDPPEADIVWQVGSRIFIGGSRPDGSDADAQANIVSVLTHPNWERNPNCNPCESAADVMLIQTDGNWPGPYQELNANDAVPALGTDLTVIGYGALETNGPTPDELMEVVFNTLPYSTCQRQFEDDPEREPGDFTDTDEQVICAGGERGRDSCQGDSGGPIFSMSGTSQSWGIQVGVTASETGSACAADDESAILTRVSNYLPWITQEVCRLSSNPPAWFNCAADTGAGPSCFSGKSQIDVKGKGSTAMDALQIGDYVRVEEGSFELVYSFGHYDPTQKARYLQVKTTSMKDPLEISPEHLIFVHKSTKTQLVAAEKLKIGDSLVTDEGPSTILSIRSIQRKGVYSPLTTSGKIMVNGVVASTYVTRGWLKDSAFVTENALHWLQHGAALPYRAYCWSTGGCEQEIYDKASGFSPWVQFWFKWEQWQLELHWIVQLSFLSVLSVPAFFTMLVGKLLASPKEVAVHFVIGFVAWKKALGAEGKSIQPKSKIC